MTDTNPAPTFPVDDTTLDMLWSAIYPEPEAETSSVGALLDLLSHLPQGVPASCRRPTWILSC